MLSWMQALRSDRVNIVSFSEDLLGNLCLGEPERDIITSEFCIKLNGLSIRSTKSSLNFIFTGKDQRKKHEIAKTVAERLKLDFVKVDCSAFRKREIACANLKPTLTTIPNPNDDAALSNGRRTMVNAYRMPSFGMVGWLLGPPRGFIVDDVAECLAEKLERNRFCLIYMENIEAAGPNFFSALLHMFEEGRIGDCKWIPDGVFIKYSIFVLSTNIEFYPPSDHFDLSRSLHTAWKKQVDNDDRFIHSCRIVPLS